MCKCDRLEKLSILAWMVVVVSDVSMARSQSCTMPFERELKLVCSVRSSDVDPAIAASCEIVSVGVKRIPR